MQTINVQIDISTPTGRRLLHEVEKHPKTAKIEYPLPEGVSGQKTYTLDEVFDECIDILSEHYNVDGRKIWKSIK